MIKANQPDQEQLRAWTWRRHFLDRSGADTLEALRRISAVYSSHPTAPLSLLARTSQVTPGSYQQLDSQREVVRLPGMRGSIFMVPAENAPAILGATRVPLEKLAGRLEYGGFTIDEYEALKLRVLEATGRPIDAVELQAVVPVEGKLMVLVRVMAYEGLILRVGKSLRSDSWSYVAAESWLGNPIKHTETEPALAWLAEAYLRGFGPARVADFAWWAGLANRRAASILDRLDTVDLGSGYLLTRDLEAEYAAVEPIEPDSLAVLPKWDALTMGYPADGRSRFIDEQHIPVAYARKSATSGDGLPLILRGGKAVATWGHRFQRNRMHVEVFPFDDSEPLNWLDSSSFQPVADLLGADEIRLALGDSAIA